MPDSKFRQKHPNLPCAVIVTAISEEYKAVRAHFEKIEEDTHPEDKTIYRCGIFSCNERTWAVAIALIGAENDPAAVETKRAIDYFKPDVVLFVGVAGGLKGVKLGDVVAATKIYGYESGKVTEQGFRPRPDAPRVSYALEQRARIEATEDDWLQLITGGRRKRSPQAFVGPIASSNIVLASKDSDEYKRLDSNYCDALAVEMEGHGFLIAVRANLKVNAIVIRGISDLIEGKNRKGENTWQITAARHASAFAFQILAKLDLDRNGIEPPQQKLEGLSATKSRLEEDTNRLSATKVDKAETIANRKGEIEQVNSEIASIEQQVQPESPPQLRKALSWLKDNTQALSEKVGKNVLENNSHWKAIIDNTDLPEHTEKRFYKVIEKYLERIYISLSTNKRDLLYEPDIPLFLPVHAYVEALRYIERRIPKDINSEVSELNTLLEFLIERLLD